MPIEDYIKLNNYLNKTNFTKDEIVFWAVRGEIDFFIRLKNVKGRVVLLTKKKDKNGKIIEEKKDNYTAVIENAICRLTKDYREDLFCDDSNRIYLKSVLEIYEGKYKIQVIQADGTDIHSLEWLPIEVKQPVEKGNEHIFTPFIFESMDEARKNSYDLLPYSYRMDHGKEKDNYCYAIKADNILLKKAKKLAPHVSLADCKELLNRTVDDILQKVKAGLKLYVKCEPKNVLFTSDKLDWWEIDREYYCFDFNDFISCLLNNGYFVNSVREIKLPVKDSTGETQQATRFYKELPKGNGALYESKLILDDLYINKYELYEFERPPENELLKLKQTRINTFRVLCEKEYKDIKTNQRKYIPDKEMWNHLKELSDSGENRTLVDVTDWEDPNAEICYKTTSKREKTLHRSRFENIMSEIRNTESK